MMPPGMFSSCLTFPCLTRRTRTVYDRPRRTYPYRQESLYHIPNIAPQAHRSPPYALAPLSPPLDPDLPLTLIPLPRPDDSLEHPHRVHYQLRSTLPPPPPIPLQRLPVYREHPIDHAVRVPPVPVENLRVIPCRDPHINHVHIHSRSHRMAGLRSNPLANFIRPQDIHEILEAVVRIQLGTDYYNRNDDIRFGALRSLGGLSDERRMEELMVDDLIRRVNLIVQLTNHTVNPRLTYAEIHPKVSDSGVEIGHYPRDFERPRRLEEFYAMDSGVLDRILQCYGLPRDIRGGSLQSSLFPYSRTSGLGFNDGARDRKLRILFEFLGLDLSDGRAGGVLSSARLERGGGLRALRDSY